MGNAWSEVIYLFSEFPWVRPLTLEWSDLSAYFVGPQECFRKKRSYIFARGGWILCASSCSKRPLSIWDAIYVRLARLKTWSPLYVWECEECPARVSIIDVGTFGVVQVKLWTKNVEKSWKIQFYCCSLIIYKIWIPWKCVKFPPRVDRIGLSSFWVLPVELWPKNV